MSLIVFWILFNDQQEEGNRSILVLRILLKGLGHAEVGIDRIRINLQSMFEILNSSLTLCQISKEVCQMNAGTKMVLINLEALLIF